MSSVSKDIILEIKNVNRTYIDDDSSKNVQALSDINLSIERGKFVSIIGASGCGKTTLLRLVGGLDSIQTGEILFNNKPITGPDPSRGYVFQQGSLFPWMTVEENIAVGLKARKLYKKDKENVGKYIELVGLKGFEKAYPHQISGGMAQRVAIARALINSPQLLLLDEPMGALDSFTRADIQDSILDIHKKSNITMLLVTHDIEEALYLSDQIIIMTPRPGKVSKILDINIPIPRNRTSEEFLNYRSKIMQEFHLANENYEPEYFI